MIKRFLQSLLNFAFIKTDTAITLNPGDTLVVTIPPYIPNPERVHLIDYLEKKLPYAKIIVLRCNPEEIQFTAIKRETS